MRAALTLLLGLVGVASCASLARAQLVDEGYLVSRERSGYFVAFDDDGRVSIFQGRRNGVLWFEPTLEAPSVYQRDQLDDQSIGLVEQQINFDSEADAADFINTSLQTTTTTSTTTTTTTTTTSTTTTSTTVAPSTTAEG